MLVPRCAAAIGNAYAVLSSPEKRKQYDQFGDEKLGAARHGHSHADFHRGFEADISPEDLFNMFFGGGFPSSKHLQSACLLRFVQLGFLRLRWVW